MNVEIEKVSRPSGYVATVEVGGVVFTSARVKRKADLDAALAELRTEAAAEVRELQDQDNSPESVAALRERLAELDAYARRQARFGSMGQHGRVG